MRDYAVHHGSTYQARGDQRQTSGKPRPQGAPRSRRAINLGRLGDELGRDLLGAALGLTEQSLQLMLDGRDAAREAQYSVHLKHKFEDAGIPANWLEREAAPIAPEFLRTLRDMAAQAPNKAPIRRVNFKRLAKAFDGRLQLLADAVEMHLPSLLNVAEGRLELDDYRFSHINPRLMRAGFPDGWLEQPNPDLNDTMLESLEQLATDEYERSLAEDEDITKTVGQTFVNPTPEQVASAEEQRAAPVVGHQQKEIEMAPSTPQTQQPDEAARQGLPPIEFKAAGFPGASAPMPHPSTAGAAAKLPRGALAFGMKKAAASGVPAKPVLQAPVSAPAAPALAPAASAAAAAPTQVASPGSRSARGLISKEASLARAAALEQLLDGARRGAKVTLWRDIMQSSLPFWGNVRRGAVLFRDDMAAQVTAALELPAGWLDNPTFPPATLAAWVTDENVPRPAGSGGTVAGDQAVTPKKPEATAAVPSAKRPYIRRTPAASPQLTLAPAAAPSLQGSAPPMLAANPQPVAPQAATLAAPAPVEPSAPTVAARPLTPAVTWQAPQGQPGPICQALVTTLTGMSTSGALTEQEALQMLNNLMSRH